MRSEGVRRVLFCCSAVLLFVGGDGMGTGAGLEDEDGVAGMARGLYVVVRMGYPRLEYNVT